MLKLVMFLPVLLMEILLNYNEPGTEPQPEPQSEPEELLYIQLLKHGILSIIYPDAILSTNNIFEIVFPCLEMEQNI